MLIRWYVSNCRVELHSEGSLSREQLSTVVNYDLGTAYKAWNTAHFNNMIKVSIDFLNNQLPGEIAYWSSAQGLFDSFRRFKSKSDLRTLAAIQDVGKAEATAQLQNLMNVQKNLQTIIVISTGFFTTTPN